MKILFACFSLIFLLVSPHAVYARCLNWPAIFEKNRGIFAGSPSDKKILILPFINKSDDPELQWVGDAIRLGLFLMLENAKNSDVIEIRSSQTTFETEEAATLGKMAGADYVVAGEFGKGKGALDLFFRFVDVAKKKSLKLEDAKVEWPHPRKFADLLVYLARRASKSFKGIKVDKKGLERIRNEPRSIAALYYWTFGMLEFEKGTRSKEAKANFEEAIKNDFNYCYGYIGLGQGLAELGFIAKIEGRPYRELYQEAGRELAKVTLLCPEIAERWGRRVTQYLEADVLQVAAVDRGEKGESGDVARDLERALAILPGDIKAYEALARFSGGSKRKEVMDELTKCR